MTDSPIPDEGEPSSASAVPPSPPPPSPYVPPAPVVPPSGAYQPPATVARPPAGYPSQDDKTWALVAHFGGAAGMLLGAGTAGWIAPLIALLARGNQSPVARQHAVTALNFQLLWSIIGVVGWITTCLLFGIVIWIAATLVGTIFGIIGGIRANEGTLYNYPMSVTMVK